MKEKRKPNNTQRYWQLMGRKQPQWLLWSGAVCVHVCVAVASAEPLGLGWAGAEPEASSFPHKRKTSKWKEKNRQTGDKSTLLLVTFCTTEPITARELGRVDCVVEQIIIISTGSNEMTQLKTFCFISHCFSGEKGLLAKLAVRRGAADHSGIVS